MIIQYDYTAWFRLFPQIESDGECISVTYRWNPWEASVRSAILARRATFNQSKQADTANFVFDTMLSSVPDTVREVTLARLPPLS